MKLPTDKQEKIHDMTTRLADIEAAPVAKNASGEYPHLRRGQVIYVNFVGSGFMLNGPHFCIVIASEAKSDQVAVMPMTSKSNPVQQNTTWGKLKGYELTTMSLSTISCSPSQGKRSLTGRYFEESRFRLQTRSSAKLWTTATVICIMSKHFQSLLTTGSESTFLNKSLSKLLNAGSEALHLCFLTREMAKLAC